MGLGVEITKMTLAFLVLINPFGALSIYLDLTQNHSTKERRKVAKTAALTVFIVITLFAVLGSSLLKILGISVGSFQVGGGILVLLIAISMMNGNDNPAKPDVGTEEGKDIVIHPKPAQKSTTAIAVVPLAIPMMAGPGGISTVIIYAAAAQNYWDTFSIVAAGLIVSLICYLIMVVAARVSNLLGETGLTILNRIMGMLLAAVSVEIIVAGLKAIFPQLAS